MDNSIINNPTQQATLRMADDHWLGEFPAMASTCQVLIDECPLDLAKKLLNYCYVEARRIESKFSRYRKDNIIYAINHSNENAIQLDDETLSLLQFADCCYQLSEKKFDITSGVLRQIWRFTENSTAPSAKSINAYKKRVGWHKTQLTNKTFNLPGDMEIDFGGIGKEYAVDRCAAILSKHTSGSFALNFGGDIYVNQARQNGNFWKIGIESPTEIQPQKIKIISLANGGMATSGSTKRYLIKNGKRFGHILNPATAMPIENAPLSVTVIAENCTQAGMLATFAMLNGENAENFLKQQAVRHWVYR